MSTYRLPLIRNKEGKVIGFRQSVRLCDYCETNDADGYVKAYDAHICEDCFEDQHGGAQ